MTAHLDEGSLQALLDGELDARAASDAEAHLAACRVCTAELDAARYAAHQLSTALGLLGPERRLAPRLVPPSVGGRRRRWGGIAAPQAALLLLFVAAVASATLPGSPVRAWIEARIEATPEIAAPDRSVPDPDHAGSVTAGTPESGVSVEPAAGQLRILVTRPDPGVVIRAVLTDSHRGGAYGIGGAAGARFGTAAGTVEVIDAPAGELRIEIPRAVPVATIAVEGRVRIVKDGDLLVSLDDPTGDRAAEIRLPLR